MKLKRFIHFAAPITEVFTILLVGNILAGLVLSQIVDTKIMSDPPTVESDFIQMTAVVSTSMVLRFGTMIVLAFFVYKLWHRNDRKQIFQQWGVSTGKHSIGKLLGMGVVLWAVTILPLQILFTVNQITPLGEGLPLWELQDDIGFRTDFLIFFLFTSMIIPPLLEETIARGYIRSRIADSYGPIGGIILCALIFTLAHGQYFKGNVLLASVLPIIIYATIGWAFVTWKTGSIIPGIVAHAIMNTPFPPGIISFSSVIIFMIILIAIYRKEIKKYFEEFAILWASSASKDVIIIASLSIMLILITIVLIDVAKLLWLVVFLIITIYAHITRDRQQV
ncbi:MAG: CPBP family intramembrane glutamic endopeptidase [Fulvivirga sp.]|nr:CPBP family intramembrane glutamic endopeptidase [Fulvivirga sp.]